jgi:hypothetical protein
MVWPWTLESHAEHVEMKHHVRLCLERIPLYAWNNHVVVQAIGHGCSLDYIEPRLLRKENTEYLACWAWTSCLSKVLRVNWVTLPSRASNVPEVGRRGLESRVIIHHAIDEDHIGETVRTCGYDFYLGYIDGEAQQHDPASGSLAPTTRPARTRTMKTGTMAGIGAGETTAEKARAGVTTSVVNPGLHASATMIGMAVQATSETVTLVATTTACCHRRQRGLALGAAGVTARARLAYCRTGRHRCDTSRRGVCCG